MLTIQQITAEIVVDEFISAAGTLSWSFGRYLLEIFTEHYHLQLLTAALNFTAATLLGLAWRVHLRMAGERPQQQSIAEGEAP